VLDARISRLAGTGGKVTGVELADGSHVPAEVVLIGVGVVPARNWRNSWGWPWITESWWMNSACVPMADIFRPRQQNDHNQPQRARKDSCMMKI